MLLKNISALLGENLDFVSNIDIQIKNKKFQKIHSKIKSGLKEDTLDCEGLLLIPGFINSHTHIADSIGKDITLNSTVNQKIHPIFGIKAKILKNTSNENLSTFMKNTCHSMIRKGITTFVDFREGGLDGALLLKKVSSDTPIRSIILGRLDFHQNSSEIKNNYQNIHKNIVNYNKQYSDKELEEDRSEWIKTYGNDDDRDEYEYETSIHTIAIEIEQLRRWKKIIYDKPKKNVRLD